MSRARRGDQGLGEPAGEPEEAHTDPMLPRITDEMLARRDACSAPTAPTVPTLDDRSLAELLAELEGDDQYALREMLAADPDAPPAPPPAAPAPAPRRADAARPRDAGHDIDHDIGHDIDHDAGYRAASPPGNQQATEPHRSALAEPRHEVPAPRHSGDHPEDYEDPAGDADPVHADPVHADPVHVDPVHVDRAVRGPDDSAPEDLVPSDIDPAFHHQRVLPKQAVDDDRVEFRQSAAGPVLRSRYGDFRPPVGRTPQTPSLTGLGLTRRASGKLGSRLFVVVFVGIFLLIAIQFVVSLVSTAGTP